MAFSAAKVTYEILVQRTRSSKEKHFCHDAHLFFFFFLSPLQIDLLAGQGTFRPSSPVVVTAQISDAALVSSVEWLVLKDGVQLTAPDATSTTSGKNPLRALFIVPAGR